MKNNLPINKSQTGIKNLAFIVAIISVFMSLNINAATINSTPSGGLWNSSTTWVGGVIPGSSDDVVITNGAILTFDLGGVTIKSLTIGQGTSGIFQWSTTNNPLTVSGNVLINAGGSLLAYTTSQTTASLNIGGNFTNNGIANLALATLNFNGSQQSGGSMSQSLTGTGIFVGQGSSGIIRSLLFQTSGNSTINTSQNLIVTLSFIHSAGSLNTNGKLTIDNTAQVYGQAFNTQVASVAVTAMGSGYSTAPVVSANGAAKWTASTLVALGNILVSGINVYAVTTAGTTDPTTAPSHTTSTALNGGATLLWVGNVGTIGNALIGTVVTGTQYFYNAKLYTALSSGVIDLLNPPNGITVGTVVLSGAQSFLYVGPAPQLSVNHDGANQLLRSLTITNTGLGITTSPGLSILNTGAGTGAIASVVLFTKIDGLTTATTQKSSSAVINGGLTVNSTQGAAFFTGVGSVNATSGGVNYTVAPQVGFAGPTGLNLVTAGGTGFTSAPTITVTGGTLISGSALVSSNFTIIVAGGKIVSVYLNAGSASCYSVPPSLAFTGGAGTGATLAFPAGSWPTATATLGSNRTVNNFIIGNPGFGYVASPNVGVGTTGTFTTAANSFTSRVALYNLVYTSILSPSVNTIVFAEGSEIPVNRRLNAFTMNSPLGATFTGNLELISATPVTLTNGKVNLGSNTLTFLNPSYLGVTSNANSSVSGIITLTSPGGSVTKTFPFERSVVITTGAGANNLGSTITTLTVSRTAAATGTVSPPTNYPTGIRTYRIQTNSGAVYGTNPTVQLNYGPEDAVIATNNADLLIAKATSPAGPWTVVSNTTGLTGTLSPTGSRTTSTFTGTGDDYLTFTTTTAPCNATPDAGTIPLVAGFCGASGSVTIALTGYSSNGSGIAFSWIQSPDNITYSTATGGTGGNTPIFTTPVISTTTYYRVVVTCLGGGVADTSNSIKAGPVNCQYNVTRNTGITYNSIMSTGTTYTSWGGTAAGDDDFTNSVVIKGTSFLYQGLPVDSFYASSNGFMSFNTLQKNAAQANNLISGATTTQVLAPFWDDLVLRGQSAVNRDNCMRYKIIGTLGSGTADIVIEWADLERFNFGPANINFQVILHESDNSIDFNYGNFQLYDGSLNIAALFSYSVGLNSLTPAANSLSDRMILQRENQNFFSTTNQNTLSLTPACNTQLHFVPAAVYTGVDPGAPGIPVNDSAGAAITIPAYPAPCIVLCDNIYTSANATPTPSIPVCNAGTPGTPDDDVWFKFVTTSESVYKIVVTPSLNYDAVFQIFTSSMIPITPVSCVNSFGIGISESITASLTPNGITYFIRVYDAGTGLAGLHNGEFAICVSQSINPPTNDDCAAATSLTVGSTCTPIASQLPATLAATASPSVPVCSAVSPGTPDDDVWYTFTTNASSGLTYNVSVTGNSTYNAVVQLFSGACGALSSVACVNNTGNGGIETLSSSSLAINTAYRVRVYHAGNGANTGDFDICVFISPPPCPAIVSPANGATVPVAGTTLTWSSVPLATGYTVFFGTDSLAIANETATPLSTNQPGLTVSTPALSTNVTYYWKVIALAGIFKSLNCNVNRFNTSPPPCPVITNPLNNTIVCYRTAFNLSWTASTGATGYDVYFDAGAGPAVTNVSSNQAGTTFNIPASTFADGQYSWRIEPRNFIGANSTCNNFTFTIVTPPTISVSATPLEATICPGESVSLTVTGATNYIWSPALGLNTSTGSSVIASPNSTVVYAVTGENVSGCGSTATQAVTVNPVPLPPVVTNYTMCTGGTIPAGEGLTANCAGGNQVNSITFPLTTPSVDEGIVCPGTSVIGSFNFPPVPAGSTLISAKLVINGIFLNTGTTESWGTEVRLNYSGSGINGTSTTCFQGATTNFVPNPFNYVTGASTPADTITLKNLLNPSGGTIVIKYNESAGDVPGASDVIFPATATFNYTISVPPSSANWYDAPTGFNLVGSGSPFDPVAAGAVNPNTPGTYTFYARCSNAFCQSTSSAASLIIGQALAANITQSAVGTICGGIPNQLTTNVTGGGTPYSYSWTPATGLSNSTISNPIATPPSTTTYTVTVTDGCGATQTSSITVNITPAPNVQVSPTSSSSCSTNPSTFTLTATGASSYVWTPATGLNSSTAASVLANPTATTIYTVTGTNSSTGCTAKATATITVSSPINVVASASPTAICPNGSSQLNASANAVSQNLYITEVTLFRTGTGATPTYPASMTGQDLVEISNISGAPIDISGFTFGDYASGSATPNHPYTFPVGAIIPANGVLVVCIGTGTDVPADRYYNTGGSSDSWSSGGLVGFILKSGSVLIDVVGLNTGYTFGAGTGVTSVEWSGVAPSAGGFAGTRRTVNSDSNVGADWTQSSASNIQNIGTYNGGYIPATPPTLTYSWSPSTFLNNPNIANPIASNVTGASNTYTVTASAGVGGCSSSSMVTLTISTFSSVSVNNNPSTPICVGSSQILSGTVTGGSGPYTYTWSPTTGLNSSTGSTVTATPTSTTSYSVSVTDNCGTTKVSSPVTVNVNPVPVTSITGAPATYTICGTGFVDLTGNGATTYAWTPSSALNSTSLSTVRATPTSTTTYTVTGTSNGCSSTASVTVLYSAAVNVTTSANTNPGCSPLTTLINANATNITGNAANYLYSAGTGTLNPMTGAVQVLGSNGDDSPTPSALSIGFTFNFEGTNYTSYSVSPDGWIKLGAVAAISEFTNVSTSSSNIPKLYPYWDDLSTGTTGSVKTLLTGSAPNRIFIVQWFVTIPRIVTNPANSTFQAWLYETSGKIEFKYGAMGPGTMSASLGITGSTSSRYKSITVSSGTASSTVADSINAVQPAAGTMYTLLPPPPSLTYVWSPAANLSSTTIANPLVSGLTSSTTYSVTVTNNFGCSTSSTINLTVNPSPPSPQITYPGHPNNAALTFCQGGSVQLNTNGTYTSYSWSPATGLSNSTIANPVATPATTTTYTVSGGSANGCSASSSVQVTVQSAAPPIITYTGYPNQAALTFCAGGNVLLNASGSYTNYSWTLNGGTTVLATTQTYSATTAGTYHVKVTAANSCTATSSITVNTVVAPPAPSITAVGGFVLCDNGSNSVTLNATGTAGYNVVWNNFDESTSPSLIVAGDDLTFAGFGVTSYGFHISVIDQVTGCSTVSNDIYLESTPCGPGVLYSSKIYLEGYYSGNGLMQWSGSGYMHVTGVSTNPRDADTVKISVMNPTSPYALVDSKLGILKTNGDVFVTFGPSVQQNQSYYIMIEHHNHLETWSATPVTLASSVVFHEFSKRTIFPCPAFGANMAITFDGTYFAIYAGDINQDDQIDGSDFLELDPQIQGGAGGYNVSDLNGDGQVDGSDFLILDINIQNGIGVAKP